MSTSTKATGGGALDRYFQLAKNGTTVRTEVLAGVTTFLAMAYIMALNPIILADAGSVESRANVPSISTAPPFKMCA